MMKRPFLALGWLGASALPALADVYRCTAEGRTVYTDRPCVAGAAPAQLPSLTPIQPQSTDSALVRQFDADARRDAANKRKADDAWLRDHAARKARAEALRSAIIEHRLIKGMTMSEVRQSIGEPSQIQNQGTPSERWIYQNGRDRRTLAFTGGVLKSDRAGTSSRRH